MDETRAIARLPHLEMEIRYRRLPEEQTEQSAITLSAMPTFEAFARFVERQGPWPWLALQPWVLAAQMIQASCQPWLGASSALLAPRHGRCPPTPRSAGPEAAPGWPKPGSFARPLCYLIDCTASLGFVWSSRATPRPTSQAGKLLVSPANETPIVHRRCYSSDGLTRRAFQRSCS